MNFTIKIPDDISSENQEKVDQLLRDIVSIPGIVIENDDGTYSTVMPMILTF
jgi:hypothetical protein